MSDHCPERADDGGDMDHCLHTRRQDLCCCWCGDLFVPDDAGRTRDEHGPYEFSKAVLDEDLETRPWPPGLPPGGQHVGRMECGILMIHKPTGIAAVSTDERSQFKNRENARAKLDVLVAQCGEVCR